MTLAASFFWVVLIMLSGAYFIHDHWQHAKDTSILFNLTILHNEFVHLAGNMGHSHGFISPISRLHNNNPYSILQRQKIITPSNSFVSLAHAVNSVRNSSKNESEESIFHIHVTSINSDTPNNSADH